MKRLSLTLFLSFLLFVGVSLPVQAQYMHTDPVTYGIKGGLNFSNYIGDDFDTDAKTRGNVGIFFKYDFSPYFALQPEADLNWTGADIKNGTQGDIEVKQTYISIPVLAKLQVPTQSGLTPNIFAGPVVGFSIHDEFDTNTPNFDELDTNTTQFGLQFGVGVNWGRALLDARYHWGLTDTFDNYDAQNSVFMISVGYGI